MSDFKLKASVQSGFASAAAYDTHRPSYPTEAVDQFLQNLEISGVKNAKVVDLAAGTGKFTEILASRPEQYDILAIEPHDDMRGELERKDLPAVKVVKGHAEDLSLVPDGSVAAVVAAQAFHWFANMQALTEIARILQPAGVFGGIWNMDDYNAPLDWDIQPGWGATMRDVVHTFQDDTPRFREGKWKQVFDEQNRSNPLSLQFAKPIFGLPIGEDTVEYEQRLTPDAIWSRLRTLSQFAILEGEELEKVKAVFFDAVKTEQADEQGRIALRGRTYFFWTSRIPDEPLKKAD